MGSPPPAGSKKEVLKFRSVKSMVIAPARTGRERRSRIAVSRTLQINMGIRSNSIPSPRIFMIVVMKFTEPRILLIPARCKEKIDRSTAPPECPTTDKGGYTVQPVPAPLSTRPELKRSVKAGGSNQNLMLLRRGKAISGALINKGTSQLPKPPIIVGITKKKIITKA